MQKIKVIVEEAAPWLFWGVVITAIALAGAQTDTVGSETSNPRSMRERPAATSTATASADCRGQAMHP